MSKTIEEVLKQYKPDCTGLSFFECIDLTRKKNKIFEKDMKKIMNQFPALQFLIFILEEIRNKPLTYYNFINLCNDYNIKTLDDFIELNNVMSKVNIGQIFKDTGLSIIDDFRGKYDNYKEISYNTLKNEIEKLIPTKYKVLNLPIVYRDVKYKIPELQDIKKFIMDSIVDRLSYYSERRDCNDFANMLKCELMRIGVGNLTFAYCEVDLYHKNWDGLFGAHAINLVYCKDVDEYKVKLIEPQNDRVFDIGDIVINTKYYKIRKLIF